MAATNKADSYKVATGGRARIIIRKATPRDVREKAITVETHKDL